MVLHGARQHDDPVSALGPAVAKTAARSRWPRLLAERLLLQYGKYPDWSYQLHYDNLAALVKADPSFGRLPSDSTVKRGHAGLRLGAQTEASAQRNAPAKHARKQTPDAGGPQL